MSNFLKPEKVQMVVDRIQKGDSIRKTSRETGVSKTTVTNIQRVMVAEKIERNEAVPLCACGQPAGHKGWCSYRLAASPKRQQFLKEWGKLTFDDIVKKQVDFLTQREIDIEIEIQKLMAEVIRIGTKLSLLKDYLEYGSSLDETPDEELEQIYIDTSKSHDSDKQGD